MGIYTHSFLNLVLFQKYYLLFFVFIISLYIVKREDKQMKSKIFFQMNEMDTISSKITENFEKVPKKVYIFSGTFKESGFKIMEEDFIDSKAKIYFPILNS